MILSFSAPDMGLIACQNGAYCQTKEKPVKQKSLMFSILQKPLIFLIFALRASSPANNRLFFGVEQETQKRNHQYTENL